MTTHAPRLVAVTMVLSSSFPGTLQRAFSRRKNSDKDDVNAKIDDRKVSIDHTVSTRDDSQHINDMDDMYRRPSFDLDFVDQPERSRTDALIGDGHPNGGYSETMTHSLSDPALYAHHHNPVGHYSYVDYYAPVPPQHQQRLTQSFQGVGRDATPLQMQPSPPPVGLPPNYYSYRQRAPQDDQVHVDRTLQARIEALQIQEQLLGLSHPDVIFAFAGIAKLYEKRGDHAQAAKIMKEIQMRSIMAKKAPQVNPNRSSHDVEDLPIEISFPR